MELYVATQNANLTAPVPIGVRSLWVMSGTGAAWPLIQNEDVADWISRSEQDCIDDLATYVTSFPDITQASDIVLDGEHPLQPFAFGAEAAGDPTVTAQLAAACALRLRVVAEAFPQARVHSWGVVAPLVKGVVNDGYLLRLTGVIQTGALGAFDPARWRCVTCYPDTSPDDTLSDSIAQITRGVTDGADIFGMNALLPALWGRARSDQLWISPYFLSGQLTTLRKLGAPRVLLWTRPEDQTETLALLVSAFHRPHQTSG